VTNSARSTGRRTKTDIDVTSLKRLDLIRGGHVTHGHLHLWKVLSKSRQNTWCPAARDAMPKPIRNNPAFPLTAKRAICSAFSASRNRLRARSRRISPAGVRVTHASRTLIAESQDSFTITDHDAFHIVATAMNQDLIDTILIRIVEKQSAWLSPYLLKCWQPPPTVGVYTRGSIFRYCEPQSIKQRLVGILQVAEKAVFTEGVWLSSQSLYPALNLFIKIAHMRWQ
jgi:hypothetical protein